jgi:hypothetical protein
VSGATLGVGASPVIGFRRGGFGEPPEKPPKTPPITRTSSDRSHRATADQTAHAPLRECGERGAAFSILESGLARPISV